MASSNPIVVGGGIQSGAPFALGDLVYVTNINPPQLSGLAAMRVIDSASLIPYISVASSTGSYPAETTATETFRVKGGIIVTGTGTDSVQIGRAASATGQQSVVIGLSATDGGQSQGVAIGPSATLNLADGVAIGANATVGGNGGSATGVAIGTNASAVNSSNGGGDALAIGTSAVAKQQDVVIGDQASSNVQNLLGNSNVVIGALAAVNVGQGAGVAIGSSASIGAKVGVAIGQGATIGSGINNVVVGQVAKVNGSATGCVVVGQGSVVSSSSQIIIGAGGVDGGAQVCQIGTPGTPLLAIVFGQGVNAVGATPGIIVQFTNAGGTNHAAANATIQAPLSTGNATPATLTIQAGILGSSGATSQVAGIAAQFDGSTTATQTRMLLYTQDTGTVQRVQTITNAAILTLLGLGAGRLLYVPA